MARKSISEEWRSVDGWPYEVSNLGRVRRKSDGALKSPTIAANGYFVVSMSRTAHVHELVCAAFHGPKPTPQHEVCHFNGIKTDVVWKNLRWGTPQDNANDRVRHKVERAVYSEKLMMAVKGRHAELKGTRQMLPPRGYQIIATEFGISVDAVHYLATKVILGKRDRLFKRGRKTIKHPAYAKR